MEDWGSLLRPGPFEEVSGLVFFVLFFCLIDFVSVVESVFAFGFLLRSAFGSASQKAESDERELKRTLNRRYGLHP
jgi:hypothetical protein